MRIYLGGGGSVQDEAALWNEFLSPGIRIVYWPFALEPSAHADAQAWLEGSLAAWGDFQVSMWTSLSGRTAADLTPDLLFVGGGNTFALLDEILRHDFLPVVRDYLRAGGAMYGGSAGAILAGADISIAASADANDVGLTRTGALDLLGGLVVQPHYAREQDAELVALTAADGRSVLAIPERSGVAVVADVARTVGPEPVHLFGPAGIASHAAGESWQLAASGNESALA
ncbi:type 1 glutamine amidotransferase family protein [Flindersiella endophytica]